MEGTRTKGRNMEPKPRFSLGLLGDVTLSYLPTERRGAPDSGLRPETWELWNGPVIPFSIFGLQMRL
jgi:hypothetical protein